MVIIEREWWNHFPNRKYLNTKIIYILCVTTIIHPGVLYLELDLHDAWWTGSMSDCNSMSAQSVEPTDSTDVDSVFLLY